MKRLALAFALVILSAALPAVLPVATALAPVAHADATVDTIGYRTKDGDTLALIAAEFYGDRKKAIFIMVENNIKNPRPLKKNERLRIPVNREITTSAGDTFSTLAAQYLGDSRRAVFLADLNAMSLEDRIPAGTQLQVPFTVTHRAAHTESFASIGALYFADKSQGEMLRRYNFMNDKKELEKDETIQVPIFHVRLTPTKMPPVDSEAKARRTARRDAVQRAAQTLPKAWQAWRSGELEQIEPLLRDLDVEYLDTNDAADVALLRGLAAIADNKPTLAKQHFEAVVDRKPSYVLRKFDYSSKILELWQQAGGQTD